MTARQVHDHRGAQIGHLAGVARARALLTESVAVQTRCRLTHLKSIQLRYASRCRRRAQIGPIFAGDHSQQPDGEGGFVLVFDDNEAVRETTAEVLVTAGFKVKEARGPDEVVRLLAEADICVVLLDVGLEHQGLAVLDRVDELPPVILMSGDSHDPEDPRASAFLPKPIPVYRLIEEVARHAAKARKTSVQHQLADRQTTRSGAGTWSGFLACTCGWFAEVLGRPSRESAAISLQATWLSHSPD